MHLDAVEDTSQLNTIASLDAAMLLHIVELIASLEAEIGGMLAFYA
jgi:hypothetical protein